LLSVAISAGNKDEISEQINNVIDDISVTTGASVTQMR
jgi:hypothetical protein